MVRVFCPPCAACTIKSYSPDLMVHPYLFIASKETETNHFRQSMSSWIASLHTIIIGPGLGRSEEALSCAQIVLELVKQHGISCIIDADCLSLFEPNEQGSRSPFAIDFLSNCSLLILTPNQKEFQRITNHSQMTLHEHPSKDLSSEEINIKLAHFSSQFPNVGILLKGQSDRLALSGRIHILECNSSPRRCGGQGDLLDGILGVLLTWTRYHLDRDANHNKELSLLSCMATASYKTRLLAMNVWNRLGQSMITGDILDEMKHHGKEVIQS